MCGMCGVRSMLRLVGIAAMVCVHNDTAKAAEDAQSMSQPQPSRERGTVHTRQPKSRREEDSTASLIYVEMLCACFSTSNRLPKRMQAMHCRLCR